MKTLFTAVLLTGIVQAGFGQTKIQGTVTDASGPVAMANVMLKDTYDGATADVNGKFEFVTSESGVQVLMVTFVGYKDFQVPVTVDGQRVEVNVRLQEVINELDAVTISAGAFTASDESRRTVFRAVDIATTAGATADIAGALNTLPGTQKVGESGRLFVRGGDGNEAKTFIDGMLVLDAYSPSGPNTPSRGRFLPFMFKGVSFSTGGYSAEYGQALSSALVLDSKDESEITRTDIALLSVGGDLTHTQAWEGGSIGGKVQYTNLRPYMGLINQEIDWETPPVQLEGIGAFRQKIGKHGIVKAFANVSRSDFSLYDHDIDNEDVRHFYRLINDYTYLNGFYKTTLNDNWMVRGGLSYSAIENDNRLEADRMLEQQEGIHAKTVFEGSLSDRVEVKTGVETIQRSYHQLFSALQGSVARGFEENVSSLFAEFDVYASNKFVTRVGGRTEYNSLVGAFALDPRISLAYKTGERSQLSLAYGKFRQSANDEFVRVNNDLLPEKAEHLILNYQLTKGDKILRIETYYKRYTDLVTFENGNRFELLNNGSGYARGVELFWRDNRSVKNLDYWVSYSFLDTERQYLQFPYEVTPAFASKHNFSVVAKYFVTKMKSQLGATFSYTSGRPYHNPNQPVYNGSVTPDYRDLSFNWSYLPKPWLIVYASCTNLLGRDNIFGYEFSDTVNESGYYNNRPIRQPAPRFLFLGIFITLSKDKSVNQLPAL